MRISDWSSDVCSSDLLLSVEPAGAVDARQHRVLLVAAPIGPRHPRQLERLRIELAGRRQMRPAAHVEPVGAGPVDGQLLALGQFGRPVGPGRLAPVLPARAQILTPPTLPTEPRN